MHKPSIAILGAGGWGHHHVRVWSELGYLRAVCDTDPRRREQVRTAYPHVNLLATPAEVFARPDLDAVVLATPAATHAELCLQALAAGKDVLVEKPLALAAADGRRLVEMAERTGRVLMVGHVLVFHPAFVELERLIAAGELGRVRYVYSNRLNLGRIRTEENALWSFAPHDVALMLRLLGELPTTVACHGAGYVNRAVADVTLSTLTFPADVRAHIFVSWLHPFKEHRFVVVGERQMAVLDDALDWANKLSLYPHTVDIQPGHVPVAHRAAVRPVPVEEREPLRAECEHFVECVRNRSDPATSGRSALDVLRVLEAAQRSLESAGQPVTLGAG